MSFKTFVIALLLVTNVVTGALLATSVRTQTHVVAEKCDIGTVCTVKVSTK